MLYSNIIIWCSLMASCVSAANINITEALASLPNCSLPCVIKSFTVTPAIVQDPVLACTNNTLQLELVVCIQKVCTIQDQLTTSGLSGSLCVGIPIEQQKVIERTATLVLGSIAISFVMLRCYSRYGINQRLRSDDYTIIAAALLIIGIMVLSITSTENGFGRHIWRVDPSKLKSLLFGFWLGEISYQVLITIVKVSILLFYLRLFEAKWFRWSTWAVLAFIVISGLAIVGLIILQCLPVHGAWDKGITSNCIDLNILLLASSGLSIFQDFIILLLPIPEIFRLNLGLKDKLGILAMFSVGLLANIVSIARLVSIFSFGTSPDPTYDNVIPSIWSIAEVVTMTVCACLPAFRALWTKWQHSRRRNKTLSEDTWLSSSHKTSTSGFRTLSSPTASSHKKSLSVQSTDTTDSRHTTFEFEMKTRRLKINDEGKLVEVGDDGLEVHVTGSDAERRKINWDIERALAESDGNRDRALSVADADVLSLLEFPQPVPIVVSLAPRGHRRDSSGIEMI